MCMRFCIYYIKEEDEQTYLLLGITYTAKPILISKNSVRTIRSNNTSININNRAGKSNSISSISKINISIINSKDKSSSIINNIKIISSNSINSKDKSSNNNTNNLS